MGCGPRLNEKGENTGVLELPPLLPNWLPSHLTPLLPACCGSPLLSEPQWVYPQALSQNKHPPLCCFPPVILLQTQVN